MKRMRIIPFVLVAVGMAAVVLSSCKKDEEEEEKVNPYATQITALVADSASQAAAVRAAVAPAKTDPNDISGIVDDNFHAQETVVLGGTAKNLSDSAKTFVATVKAIRDAYGDPIPKNNATLTALSDKSATYTATIASLADLRAKAKALGY